MEKVVVARATIADAPVLARLAQDIWTEHYTPLIGAAQVDYMLRTFQNEESITRQMAEDGYVYYIVRAGEEPAGYCCVRWEETRRALFLSKLYVAAPHRRKGLSKKLLAAVLDKHPDCSFVYLTVNKGNAPSIAAYQAMGFMITGEVTTDIGEGFVMDDYVMTLRVLENHG